MKVFVYGLVDPRTKFVRYIGKTERGYARPKQHRTPSQRKARTHKNAWINELLVTGLNYEIVCLEATTLEIVVDAEMWWIAYGRLSGWPLTNGTDGGIGARGREVSLERRAAMSNRSKQQWANMTAEEQADFTEAARLRMLEPRRQELNRQLGVERMADPVRRARSSVVAVRIFGSKEARIASGERGRRLFANPEHQAMMIESARTPEARAKISAAATVRMNDPKVRAANSARQTTPEARKLQSDRLKAYYADPVNREASRQRALAREQRKRSG